MQLHRLDNPSDTKAGGILCVFEDKHSLEITWNRGAPIVDTLTAAKDLAARFVDQLIQTGQGDRVSRLNLPSVVAAMQRHLRDWSDKRRAALYAEPVASAADIAAERSQTAGDAAPRTPRGGAHRDPAAPLQLANGAAPALAAQRANSGTQGTGAGPAFE